eukprot:1195870-Prorocentrum_minimum.AAC.6
MSASSPSARVVRQEPTPRRNVAIRQSRQVAAGDSFDYSGWQPSCGAAVRHIVPFANRQGRCVWIGSVRYASLAERGGLRVAGEHAHGRERLQIRTESAPGASGRGGGLRPRLRVHGGGPSQGGVASQIAKLTNNNIRADRRGKLFLIRFKGLGRSERCRLAVTTVAKRPTACAGR